MEQFGKKMDKILNSHGLEYMVDGYYPSNLEPTNNVEAQIVGICALCIINEFKSDMIRLMDFITLVARDDNHIQNIFDYTREVIK